jgi:hypothetical protein
MESDDNRSMRSVALEGLNDAVRAQIVKRFNIATNATVDWKTGSVRMAKGMVQVKGVYEEMKKWIEENLPE